MNNQDLKSKSTSGLLPRPLIDSILSAIIAVASWATRLQRRRQQEFQVTAVNSSCLGAPYTSAAPRGAARCAQNPCHTSAALVDEAAVAACAPGAGVPLAAGPQDASGAGPPVSNCMGVGPYLRSASASCNMVEAGAVDATSAVAPGVNARVAAVAGAAGPGPTCGAIEVVGVSGAAVDGPAACGGGCGGCATPVVACAVAAVCSRACPSLVSWLSYVLAKCVGNVSKLGSVRTVVYASANKLALNPIFPRRVRGRMRKGPIHTVPIV